MIETISEFTLESGTVLREAPVAYQTWGQLNAERDNAVIVCHALTGSADVEAWWGGLLGPGRAFDPERHFVVGFNVPGSPYGSVSPVTTNPATGTRYGPDFPHLTIRDTVRLHRRVLDRLDVRGAALAAGGSMGGMQVLEWAFEQDEAGGPFVRALVPVAVGGRHSAWQIGWSEAQRQALFADPHWQGGYYDPETPPRAGLAAARMAAMVSYRSYGSYRERFGRERMGEHSADVQGSEPPVDAASPAPFAIESYLRYQGKKLAGRFDANCYVHLTRQMDSHDVARSRGRYREVLRSILQPALVVGIDSDVLYPLEEQRELADHLPNATLEVLHSPHGHDAFLIEEAALNEVIRGWQEQRASVEASVTSPPP